MTAGAPAFGVLPPALDGPSTDSSETYMADSSVHTPADFAESLLGQAAELSPHEPSENVTSGRGFGGSLGQPSTDLVNEHAREVSHGNKLYAEEGHESGGAAAMACDSTGNRPSPSEKEGAEAIIYRLTVQRIVDFINIYYSLKTSVSAASRCARERDAKDPAKSAARVPSDSSSAASSPESSPRQAGLPPPSGGRRGLRCACRCACCAAEGAECSRARSGGAGASQASAAATQKDPKTPCVDLPQEGLDVLKEIARTGQCRYPWALVKTMMAAKMEQMFTDMAKSRMKRRLAFDWTTARNLCCFQVMQFLRPPVTVQRLCEVLLRPMYAVPEKFFFAMRKLLLVRGCLYEPLTIPAFVQLSSIPGLRFAESKVSELCSATFWVKNPRSGLYARQACPAATASPSWAPGAARSRGNSGAEGAASGEDPEADELLRRQRGEGARGGETEEPSAPASQECCTACCCCRDWLRDIDDGEPLPPPYSAFLLAPSAPSSCLGAASDAGDADGDTRSDAGDGNRPAAANAGSSEQREGGGGEAEDETGGEGRDAGAEGSGGETCDEEAMADADGQTDSCAAEESGAACADQLPSCSVSAPAAEAASPARAEETGRSSLVDSQGEEGQGRDELTRHARNELAAEPEKEDGERNAKNVVETSSPQTRTDALKSWAAGESAASSPSEATDGASVRTPHPSESGGTGEDADQDSSHAFAEGENLSPEMGTARNGRPSAGAADALSLAAEEHAELLAGGAGSRASLSKEKEASAQTQSELTWTRRRKEAREGDEGGECQTKKQKC
ncbi:hypothetical protein BESB_048720 [Besnoitia besnoiti]|uniref:PPP4R2 n=1 Tax=Besnoitia besnoiti TaxID=94643 RepID=A0A2A9MMA4_BESBE|nr:hypothetical protein BESB_048720 [Besnoitia besnoiti]PFH36680.1 hypothetical protein BESB_048720 [Besnoitia besnoiti]